MTLLFLILKGPVVRIIESDILEAIYLETNVLDFLNGDSLFWLASAVDGVFLVLIPAVGRFIPVLVLPNVLILARFKACIMPSPFLFGVVAFKGSIFCYTLALFVVFWATLSLLNPKVFLPTGAVVLFKGSKPFALATIGVCGWANPNPYFLATGLVSSYWSMSTYYFKPVIVWFNWEKWFL